MDFFAHVNIINWDVSGMTLFNKKHRRSPSHYNLKYGRENSPPGSPVKEATVAGNSEIEVESREGMEVNQKLFFLACMIVVTIF